MHALEPRLEQSGLLALQIAAAEDVQCPRKYPPFLLSQTRLVRCLARPVERQPTSGASGPCKRETGHTLAIFTDAEARTPTRLSATGVEWPYGCKSGPCLMMDRGGQG